MTGLELAKPGQPPCGHVVGPVWKSGGESWACQKPVGHDLADGHEARDADGRGGSWWVHEVCRPDVPREAACAVESAYADVQASRQPNHPQTVPDARTAPRMPQSDPATHHRNEEA